MHRSMVKNDDEVSPLFLVFSAETVRGKVQDVRAWRNECARNGTPPDDADDFAGAPGNENVDESNADAAQDATEDLGDNV